LADDDDSNRLQRLVERAKDQVVCRQVLSTVRLESRANRLNRVEMRAQN
jgi:hypothetical protein